MLHAFKLYSGSDNASHVVEGTVAQNDPSESFPSISKNRHHVPHWTGRMHPSDSM